MTNVEKLLDCVGISRYELVTASKNVIKEMSICESGLLIKSTCKYLSDGLISCVSRDNEIFTISELELIFGNPSSKFTKDDLKTLLINF